MTVLAICTACGATVEWYGEYWADVVSGDDGGTFDICPERFDAQTDSGGHVVNRTAFVRTLPEPAFEAVRERLAAVLPPEGLEDALDSRLSDLTEVLFPKTGG